MSNHGDNVGSDQIRAFVERILRMKEEARAINDDIREIYAEAKVNGFDKTVLGQIVNYIEKRDKDPDTLAYRSTLFDLYLGAIDGTGTVSATHAHEANQSTAALKEVRPMVTAPARDHESEDGSHSVPAADGPAAPAGTQAPPVDTLSPSAQNALALRPLCRHASDLTNCAGYGKVTCHGCLKAHADAEGLPA